MNKRAERFRESRLALLRFYASPGEQLDWQMRSLPWV